MEIKILSENIDPKIYNLSVSHPLQSYEWGEAKKSIGNKIIRISDSNTNYLMTIHNIPHTSYKIGYIPRSPMLSEGLISYLIDYCQRHKIIYIKIEPYIKLSEADSKIYDSYQGKIIKSPHPLFPEWTNILDITISEEELLKKMKPKTRYNINLAIRKGVVVREESGEKGFAIFSKLYFETCERQKYYGHSEEYHRKVWEALKNSIAHIIIAYFNNEPLAAYELFHFGKGIYYPYGGTSETHRNLMGANLIMWEAIRLGKRLGAEYFDMWGSLAPSYDTNHDWSGFTKFKEGYGGNFTHLIGSYDIIADRLLYNSMNFLHRIRNHLLKSGAI